jgi:hypothetical protein
MTMETSKIERGQAQTMHGTHGSQNPRGLMLSQAYELLSPVKP